MPVGIDLEQRRRHRARVVAQRPDPLEVGVELHVHHVAHAGVDDGDAVRTCRRRSGRRRRACRRSRAPRRTGRRRGPGSPRVVGRAGRLVDEAVLHEVGVGHEGDALEAEVGLAGDVQLGEVGREVPLRGGGERGARRGRVEAQDGVQGERVAGVVALGRDVERTVGADREALGVGLADAAGEEDLLAGAPAVGGVGHPQVALLHQAEHPALVLHGPQHVGFVGSNTRPLMSRPSGPVVVFQAHA